MARTNDPYRRRPKAALLGHVVTESGNVRDTVDWSKFDQYPENSVTCVCGHTYRSHCKFVQPPGHRPLIVARKACAVCGGERLRSAVGDTEHYVL